MENTERKYGKLKPGSWKKVILYIFMLIVILVAMWLLSQPGIVRNLFAPKIPDRGKVGKRVKEQGGKMVKWQEADASARINVAGSICNLQFFNWAFIYSYLMRRLSRLFPVNFRGLSFAMPLCP